MYQTLLQIKRLVESWKKRHKRISNSTILRKLKGEYPLEKCRWIKDFFDLSEALPRKRYVSSTLNGLEISQTDPDGSLPPCKLSEPQDWSILDTAVRIMQTKLNRETAAKYPRLEIQSLIRSESPAR